MLLQRYIFGLLFCVLVFGAGLALLGLLPLLGQGWRQYIWFVLGMVVYVIILGLNESLFKINSKLIRTFVHELTHTLFAWLCFREVRNFRVSHYRGGQVTIVGGTNMLIMLSPYCIPIFTLILLIIKPFLLTQFAPLIEVGIGLTYLFHLHTNILQTGIHQTDITKYPLLTSFSFITLFQILFAGVVLLSFHEGLNAFLEFPMLAIDKLRITFQHFFATH